MKYPEYVQSKTKTRLSKKATESETRLRPLKSSVETKTNLKCYNTGGCGVIYKSAPFSTCSCGLISPPHPLLHAISRRRSCEEDNGYYHFIKICPISNISTTSTPSHTHALPHI